MDEASKCGCVEPCACAGPVPEPALGQAMPSPRMQPAIRLREPTMLPRASRPSLTLRPPVVLGSPGRQPPSLRLRPPIDLREHPAERSRERAGALAGLAQGMGPPWLQAGLRRLARGRSVLSPELEGAATVIYFDAGSVACDPPLGTKECP